MNPRRVLVLSAIAVGLLAACGSSTSGSSVAATTSPVTSPPATTAATAATAAAAAATLTVKDFTFTAPTVAAGAKVSVKNGDGAMHTVTADDGKSFSVAVDSGGTASFAAPATPGSYAFHGNIHSSMKGTLVVTG